MKLFRITLIFLTLIWFLPGASRAQQDESEVFDQVKLELICLGVDFILKNEYTEPVNLDCSNLNKVGNSIPASVKIANSFYQNSKSFRSSATELNDQLDELLGFVLENLRSLKPGADWEENVNTIRLELKNIRDTLYQEYLKN